MDFDMAHPEMRITIDPLFGSLDFFLYKEEIWCFGGIWSLSGGE